MTGDEEKEDDKGEEDEALSNKADCEFPRIFNLNSLISTAIEFANTFSHVISTQTLTKDILLHSSVALSTDRGLPVTLDIHPIPSAVNSCNGTCQSFIHTENF